MMTRACCLLMVLALAGCASSGPGEDRVPVYTALEDVPCEFELVRTLRVEAFEAFEDRAQLRSAQSRVLGREGKRLGADAVLAPRLDQEPLPEAELTGTMVVLPRGTPPPTSMPPQGNEASFIFEGNAIRFVEGTCRG